MTEQLSEALRQSMEEVLEKMFFVRALEEPPEPALSPARGLLARLSFEGDPSGRLTLHISEEAARSISADFLGKDEWEVTAEEIGEVICELANMICGSILSRVESGASFRLGPPRLEESSPDEPAAEEGCVIHRTAVGQGTLTVALQTETPVWTTAARSAY